MRALIIRGVLVAIAMTSQVFAHGAVPKHGGNVQTANELQFELVVEAHNAKLYVEDQGELVSTADAKGKLKISNGAEKTEVFLQPTDINALEVRNVPQLKKGAKVIAHITLADGKDFYIRFSVK